MRTSKRVAALAAACVLFLAPGAWAQASLDRLIAALKSGGDFRVQTQAALALGASKNPGAVAPLCGALSDPNTTVRVAAAAALGKLALGGADCLKARLASEPSESVRATIQKAIDSVEGGAEPFIDESTRFYIQLGKVTDKSGRSDSSVDKLFRDSFREAATATGGVAFAPLSETPDKAKQRIAKNKAIRAFYLAPSVPAFDYTGGTLTVKVSIVVFSYPARVMLGSFTRTASISGVEAGDTASEDELLRYTGESALKNFVLRAAQFQ
jgi:hypothetical protein